MKTIAFALTLAVASAASADCTRSAVENWLAVLGADDAALRWGAASSLGRCGGAAVPGLVQSLAAESPLARQAAARALGLLGRDAIDAIPALVSALEDGEPLVREAAADALGRVGPEARAAVTPLIETFGGDDPYVAGAAAIALARIGDAAVASLTAALDDKSDDVRRSVVIALGRLGPAAAPASAALKRALTTDSLAVVRSNAADALGAIGDATAVDALTAALADADADVRRSASTAILRLDPKWRGVPKAEQVIATIERLVPRLMAEHHVPGVSIAVIRDGAPVWTKAFGVVDARTKQPVTDETLFEAASMSKPVFAIVAMQLVDEGKLDLDRPLVSYLSDTSPVDDPARARITARMILSHTSGMPNWRPGDEEREGPVPQLFAPGARFSYSGEGIFYLQRVVETITGLPLDLLARATLFEPLGLERTTFAWTPAAGRVLASGHDDKGAWRATSHYVHPNAAYTLYTNAKEYARLLTFVMSAARGGSQLLSKSAATEMLRAQVQLDAREPIERPGAARGTTVSWGLGFSQNATPSGTIHHHSGANRTGFRCFSQFAPARGSGIVIFTNGLDGGELWTRLVAAVGDL
jgi:CubicO group peptidase (beta-lactamase class C family)